MGQIIKLECVKHSLALKRVCILSRGDLPTDITVVESKRGIVRVYQQINF